MSVSDFIAVGTLLAVFGTLAIYVIQARELARQTRLLTKTTEAGVEQTKALVRQTELANVTSRASFSQEINAMMHSINRIFVDAPLLRKFFYDGHPLPDDEAELAKTLTVAEIFVDFMSMALNHETLLREDEAEGWRRYFTELASSSPAICEFWWRSRRWYEEPMWMLINAAVCRALGVEDDTADCVPGSGTMP